MYSGAPDCIAEVPESLTGAFLSGRRRIAIPQKRRKPGKFLQISALPGTT